MSVAPCHCPTHEHAVATGCRRAGHAPMTPLEHDLCSGKCALASPCNEAISRAYRARWDGVDLETGHKQPRCPFLWKRVRDERGTIQTKACGTCPGARGLDLFECRCPSRRLPSGGNDQVTLADCQTCIYRPRPTLPEARKLLLVNHLSPGDILCMTAAVHSLHKAHPGEYLIAVDTAAPALWEHSPLVVQATDEFERVQTSYPAIHRCNQEPLHVLAGYTEFLAENLRVKVPLAVNRPLVYLSRAEREWIPQVQEVLGRPAKYWLVNAGVKQDYTTKQYPFYQEVVHRLQGRVLFVQVGQHEHLHRPLKGAVSLLGKTDMRQLVRLVYHAQGVLCGTTLLMHLAAALEKPAVVLAGGREPRSWNTYPRQTLLSNVGCLPCCATRACWKSRTVKRDDGQEQDGSLCENPVLTEPPAPKCMALISPETVAQAILGYYEGGVLSA